MKKNFVVKTLASTLALAMVVTAAPAMPASAAKAPALNKKAKTIYINENDLGSSFDFNVKNKVSGSKYKWTTSNKAVATVNSKGVVEAGTKTGKATITCKITLKNKKTKTLKATVTVKENATAVEVKNAPAEAIAIGENAYDFDSTMTSASGAKATDYRTWEIEEGASNTAGATVDAKNGKVTTTKAGEFKIRVRAYQNKVKLAANDTVDSDWTTVKVVASLKEVKQTVHNVIVAKFDDDMSKTVKASDFVILNKTTNRIVDINNIDFDSTGKDVSIHSYSTFDDAGKYELKYKDTVIDFETSVGAVARVELATTECYPEEAKEIKYILRNANDVDITDTVYSGNIDIDVYENKDGFYDNFTKLLTIVSKGSEAKVKVTYHTFKYENGIEQGVQTTSGVIRCIDKTAAVYGQYENYTFSDSDSIDWADVKAAATTLHENESKYLHVKALDSNKNQITGLTFKAHDDNIILVDNVEFKDCALVTAVKAGTTSVNVYKDGKYLWSLPVTVKQAQVAKSISLEKNTLSISSEVPVYKNGVGINIHNQYGEKFASTENVTVEFTNNYSSVAAYQNAKQEAPLVTVDNTTKKLMVNSSACVDGTGAPQPGTYRYKVMFSSNSKTYTMFTVTVVANDATPNAYTFNVSANSVDTTIVDKKTDAATYGKVELEVLGTNKKGIVIDNYASGASIAITGPDGKLITDNTKYISKTTTGTVYFTAASVDTATNTISKNAQGTYKIEMTYDSKTVTRYIRVTDSQVAPVARVIKNQTQQHDPENAILECVTVNGKTHIDDSNITVTAADYILNANSTVKGDSLNVKFVKYNKEYTLSNGTVVTYNFTLPISGTNSTIYYNLR